MVSFYASQEGDGRRFDSVNFAQNSPQSGKLCRVTEF
jgi:hypothetical protein